MLNNFILLSTKKYGEQPALLAHCAGSIMIRPLHRTTQDQYRNCLQNNLESAFFTLQKFVHGLIDRKSQGSAELVSSVAGRIGIVNHTAVAAAKAGIEGLIRSAASDYANRGIRINGIAPGLFRSAATEGFFPEKKLKRSSPHNIRSAVMALPVTKQMPSAGCCPVKLIG
jgi:NAD(P)-dependent dehydrogenase (short-subunit alcohol dehydrogenase family)